MGVRIRVRGRLKRTDVWLGFLHFWAGRESSSSLIRPSCIHSSALHPAFICPACICGTLLFWAQNTPLGSSGPPENPHCALLSLSCWTPFLLSVSLSPLPFPSHLSPSPFCFFSTSSFSVSVSGSSDGPDCHILILSALRGES